MEIPRWGTAISQTDDNDDQNREAFQPLMSFGPLNADVAGSPEWDHLTSPSRSTEGEWGVSEHNLEDSADWTAVATNPPQHPPEGEGGRCEPGDIAKPSPTTAPASERSVEDSASRTLPGITPAPCVPAVLPEFTGDSSDTALAAFDESAAPNSKLGSVDWYTINELLLGRGPLFQHAGTLRPPQLSRVNTRQIFLERPKVRRARTEGCDKWRNSGGKKGGLLFWFNHSSGIRKCYVRIEPLDGTEPFFGAEFFRVARIEEQLVPDQTAAVFIVDGNQGTHAKKKRVRQKRLSKQKTKTQPVKAESPADAVSLKQESTNPEPVQSRMALDACVKVRATKNQSKFISFVTESETDAGANPMEIELGAVVKQGRGVKLQSRKGDFAEWHRRRDDEPPFEEGDVVGFDAAGMISRKTKGAAMLGVVSRQAVVEGSLPPQAQRHLFDTVAHVGVVPVKVVRPSPPMGCKQSPCALQPGPGSGDVLIPSGRNDGTAVVADLDDHTTGGSIDCRKIAVVLNSEEWKVGRGTGESQLVSSIIVSPVATQRADGTRAALRSFQRVVFALLMLAILLSLSAILFRPRQSQASLASTQTDRASRCFGNHLLRTLIELSLPNCSNAPEQHVEYNTTNPGHCPSASCILHDAALMGLPHLQQLSLTRQPQWPFCRCEWSCKRVDCCNAGILASANRPHMLCGSVQAPPWPLLRPPTLEQLNQSVQNTFIDRCVSALNDSKATSSRQLWHDEMTGSSTHRLLKSVKAAASPAHRFRCFSWFGDYSTQYTVLANGKGSLIGAAKTNDSCTNYGLRPITEYAECFPAYQAVCNESKLGGDTTSIPCGSGAAQLVIKKHPPKPPGCFINTNVDIPFNPKFNPELTSPEGVSDAFSIICGGCVNVSLPPAPTPIPEPVPPPIPAPAMPRLPPEPKTCSRQELHADCAQHVVPQQLEVTACAATALYNGLQLGVASWEKLDVQPQTFMPVSPDPWGTTVPFVGNHSSFPTYGCIAFYQGAFRGRAFFNTHRGTPVIDPILADVGFPVPLKVHG